MIWRGVLMAAPPSKELCGREPVTSQRVVIVRTRPLSSTEIDASLVILRDNWLGKESKPKGEVNVDGELIGLETGGVSIRVLFCYPVHLH